MTRTENRMRIKGVGMEGAIRDKANIPAQACVFPNIHAVPYDGGRENSDVLAALRGVTHVGRRRTEEVRPQKQ
jgi:hypothetical protein